MKTYISSFIVVYGISFLPLVNIVMFWSVFPFWKINFWLQEMYLLPQFLT